MTKNEIGRTPALCSEHQAPDMLDVASRNLQPRPMEAISTDQEAISLNEEATSTGLSTEQYQRKMQRRKEVQEQRLAERSYQKGLIIVNTGTGKGKTTAALGMVLRSLGHGYRVAIVQFIKGAWEPAEKTVFEPWTTGRNSSSRISRDGRRLYLGNPRSGARYPESAGSLAKGTQLYYQP